MSSDFPDGGPAAAAPIPTQPTPTPSNSERRHSSSSVANSTDHHHLAVILMQFRVADPKSIYPNEMPDLPIMKRLGDVPPRPAQRRFFSLARLFPANFSSWAFPSFSRTPQRRASSPQGGSMQQPSAIPAGVDDDSKTASAATDASSPQQSEQPTISSDAHPTSQQPPRTLGRPPKNTSFEPNKPFKMDPEDIQQMSNNVATIREEMLEQEKMIHQTLQSVETARRRYLTPPDGLPCEDLIKEVTECYDTIQAAWAKKQSRWRGTRVSEGVNLEVLKCRPLVDSFRNCAMAKGREHTAENHSQ